MKIGVLLNNFGGFPETGRGARAIVDLARHAETLGFDSVWVTDHVVLPVERRTPYPHDASGVFPYSWQQQIFEPISLMAALATATERVEIGVSVLVIPYRHPLLTAKMLATVDQLAEGRVVLGAGVGWLREEFEALGLAPEVFERRGAVTMDALRAMRTAWTAPEGADHAGEFFRFEAIGARPQPFRKPHPPIWIGGQGERALRRSVELGQGYLAISSEPTRLGRETQRLRQLCDDAGRDFRALDVGHIDGLILTNGADRGAARAAAEAGMTLVGRPPQIVDALGAWAEAGLTHLVAGVSRAQDGRYASVAEALEEVAESVLPAARAL